MTSVRDERPVTGSDDGDRSRRFWLHLLDNFLRRWPLYALPVVVLFAIGAAVANGTVAMYESRATLDAAENPLVGDLDLRGTNTGIRLTPAEATSRLVSEQLRTDVFAAAVAEESGLSQALDNGLISTGSIRRNVSVGANGDSIIVISATWTDPATAQALAQAAIETYREYVVETVATDSVAAVGFYTGLREQALDEVAAAQQTLEDHVDSLPALPEGATRPIEEELTIGRLNSALDRAQTKVDAAQTEIEAAQLQATQARSEAGQSVRVIDPPNLPAVPGSRLMSMAAILLAFGALGLLISATALVVTTALDQSVRFGVDAVAATGSPIVTTVPEVAALRPKRRRRRRRATTEPDDEEALDSTDEPDGDGDEEVVGDGADDVSADDDADDEELSEDSEGVVVDGRDEDDDADDEELSEDSEGVVVDGRDEDLDEEADDEDADSAGVVVDGYDEDADEDLDEEAEDSAGVVVDGYDEDADEDADDEAEDSAGVVVDGYDEELESRSTSPRRSSRRLRRIRASLSGDSPAEVDGEPGARRPVRAQS